MPKIPDFSKFDLQSIVNSVKSIINPDTGTPNVTEGDPIGTKIVQISSLLQGVAGSQEQSAKDLHRINSLLNELYKDLEQFRKLEAERHQKQQAETLTPTEAPAATSKPREAGVSEPKGESLSTAQGKSSTTTSDEPKPSKTSKLEDHLPPKDKL